MKKGDIVRVKNNEHWGLRPDEPYELGEKAYSDAWYVRGEKGVPVAVHERNIYVIGTLEQNQAYQKSIKTESTAPFSRHLPGAQEFVLGKAKEDISSGLVREEQLKTDSNLGEWTPVSTIHESLPKHVSENIQEVYKDSVNHPPHYTQGGIECIDAIKAQLTPEEYRGYLKGNIAKYVWREKHKGGSESLKKARWYLNKLVDEGS